MLMKYIKIQNHKSIACILIVSKRKYKTMLVLLDYRIYK